MNRKEFREGLADLLTHLLLTDGDAHKELFKATLIKLGFDFSGGEPDKIAYYNIFNEFYEEGYDDGVVEDFD